MVATCMHHVGMHTHKEAHSVLLLQPLHLLLVFVVGSGLRIALTTRGKLLLQLSQLRIRTNAQTSAHVYTHLRTVVAASHRTVAYERHTQSQPRCRHRSAHASYACSHHHHVVFAGITRLKACAVDAAAECVLAACVVGRNKTAVGSEQYGIATAVKSREVVQSQLRSSSLKPHAASLLPLPTVARLPNGAHTLAAHAHLKGSCTGLCAPWRSPVVGTHIYLIRAAAVYVHRSDGIAYGHTHAVGNQVGRPHEIHKLLVDHPSATLAEALGFNYQALGMRLRHCSQSQYRSQQHT